MAVIFKNNPSFGTQLGQSVGSGLGQGLQALLNQKIQEMQQRKTAQAYQQSGLPGAYAQLPESVIKQLLQNQQENEPVFNLGGQQGAQQSPFQQQQQEPLQQLQQLLQPQQQQETSLETQDLLSLLGGRLEDIQRHGPVAGIKGRKPLGIEKSINKSQEIKPNAVIEPGKISAVDQLKQSGAPITRKSLDAALKLDQAESTNKKQEFKEKAEQFKFNKKALEDNDKAVQDAREALHRVEHSRKLDRDGKLDSPGYVKFLENSGFDISNLLSADSQDFVKTNQGYLRGLKSIYGARVSNQELEQYLKTIPSLLQSPEGRQRLYASIEMNARAALERDKAIRDIIKDNKGTPPFDLTTKVNERVGKRLDSLSRRFKEEISRPAPKGESGYKTAFLAGLGHTVGAIPKLAGAALGGFGLKKLLGRLGGGGNEGGGGGISDVLDKLSGGDERATYKGSPYIYKPRSLDQIINIDKSRNR